MVLYQCMLHELVHAQTNFNSAWFSNGASHTRLAPGVLGPNVGQSCRAPHVPLTKKRACGAACELWHLEIVGRDMMMSLPTTSRRCILSCSRAGGRAQDKLLCSPHLTYSSYCCSRQYPCYTGVPPPQSAALCQHWLKASPDLAYSTFSGQSKHPASLRAFKTIEIHRTKLGASISDSLETLGQ